MIFNMLIVVLTRAVPPQRLFPDFMKLKIHATHLCSSVFICGSLAFSLPAAAAVTAKDVWVRGTVPAQKTTGAFATLTSTEDAKLVAVKSPAARIVEIHTMTSSGGVMHMHAVDAVPLPAGKPVQLQGDYHVMLVDLVKPLKAGDKVPLSFVTEDRRGRRATLEVSADVRPLGQ